MKSNVRRAYYHDDRREVSFIVTMALLWALVGLILVLRDPLWRMFYEGQIVSMPGAQTSGWMEMDEDLIERLTNVDASPRPGVDALEAEFAAALQDRAAQESAHQSPPGPPPQLAADEKLRDMARARAAARAPTYPAGQVSAPELLYPELYVALAKPDRLMRVVEAAQPMTVASAGSGVPAELVGGWMNRMGFANVMQQPTSLEVGVGVTPMPQGQGASVDVLVAQTFVQLDAPLPSVAQKETPLQLIGHKLTGEDVSLYFKGPQDASFVPLPVQWTGDRFSATITWSQGAGTYALRARRADRLSDPRPIFVN